MMVYVKQQLFVTKCYYYVLMASMVNRGIRANENLENSSGYLTTASSPLPEKNLQDSRY
jgi:hypothetical protein